MLLPQHGFGAESGAEPCWVSLQKSFDKQNILGSSMHNSC